MTPTLPQIQTSKSKVNVISTTAKSQLAMNSNDGEKLISKAAQEGYGIIDYGKISSKSILVGKRNKPGAVTHAGDKANSGVKLSENKHFESYLTEVSPQSMKQTKYKP